MKYQNHLIAFLLLFATGLTGQTTLGPGDVMFTMINTDNTDAFAFVLLTDVTSNTTFRVTKGEYKNGALESSDGTTEITFTSASSCGAEFLFTSQLSANGSSTGFYNPTSLNGGGGVTSALVEGSSMTLASSGDGLIAFQGGTYITALQKCGHEFGFDNSQCSELPPGLTEGMNAVYINDPSFPVTNTSEREPDNVKFDCSFTTGTPAQIAAAICTPSRWLQDNNNTQNYGSGCGFTCLASCVEPVLTSISSSPASPCPGDLVTITINGSLGDANQWRLHEGGCNNPILQTTQTQSFTVTAGASTTYHVTVQDCSNTQICVNTTVTPAVETANAGTDQLLLAGTSTNLSGSASGAGTGMWSTLTGDGNGVFGNLTSPTSTFTGTAGQAYSLRWTITGGGCGTTSDDVEISFSQGGTALMAGDLAFIGFNSDAPDDFTFILLTEIEAGTVISFTDMGWLQAGAFRTSVSEGVISLTFDRNYSCGDAFHLIRTVLSGNNWEAFDEDGITAGTNSLMGGVPDIGTVGDQIFAFQGISSNPSFLAGVHVGEPWSEAIDNSSSAQPPALTGNNTSVNLPQAIDNGIYDCSVTSSSPLALRTAINDPSNWTLSDAPITLTPSCDFDCQDCIEPVITGLAVNLDPVCQGTPVTITVTGNLNGATRWAVYESNCGTDLVTTSTTNMLTFSPDVSGTYYVAGIDGCVATPNCTLISINVAGNEADVPQDLIVTPEATTFANIQPLPPTDGQVATLEFLTGDGLGTVSGPVGSNIWTINGTSGQSYTLRYTHSGGSCPTTFDDFAVAFTLSADLALGDIAFTGINTSIPDGFSFVALTEITAGTTINFTERGWDDGFHTDEGSMALTLTSSLSCGESVYLQSGASTEIVDWSARLSGSNESVGTLSQIGSTTAFALNSNGDQVFAYQGSDPTAGDQSGFIAGIHTGCNGCGVDTWDTIITTDDNNDSAKPSVFDTGDANYAVNFPSSPNNAKFDCTNIAFGSASTQRDALTDASNWTESAASLDLSTSCAPGCIEPPTAVCANITVQIGADGNPVFTAADLDGGSTGDNMPFMFATDVLPLCSDISNPAAPIAIILTATNSAGVSASCISQVTVEDNIAPTFDCTDITVDLDAAGEYFITDSDVYTRMVQNWDDNCATAPVSYGSTNRTITCANSVGGTFSFFFGARDGNGQEATCTATITVNDPTLTCDDNPVANCQDFQANLASDETMYTVNAADFDNNSTDDNGIAGFVFSDQVATIESPGTGGNFPIPGMGQVIKAEQSGFIQTIRLKFGAASSNRTIHLYNSNNGSGVGGVGTPAYSQSGIELVDGTGGVFTEIRLQTPFPVTEGDFYSFAMEGTTSALYGFDDTYTDGQFLVNYNLNSQNDIDLAFEVDFLGSSTQEFPLGEHPVTIYAVDDAGQLSAGCNATFTVDEVLPVEWLSFSAIAGAKTVELQWETTEEPDNAGFHVERSPTGEDWYAIGEVAARTGADQRYDFTDAAPIQGTSYYRLRQTDFDGLVTYSPVETVAFYGKDRIVLSPNPATGEVNVSLPADAQILGLIDVTGRMTKVRFDGQSGQLRTDVSNLPAGIYFLRVRLADGELSARRLMVR